MVTVIKSFFCGISNMNNDYKLLFQDMEQMTLLWNNYGITIIMHAYTFSIDIIMPWQILYSDTVRVTDCEGYCS